MNSFSSFSHKASKSNQTKPANFIEAFKDLGDSFKKQAGDASLGAGQGIIDQLFGVPKTNKQTTHKTGELHPDQPFNFEEYLQSREKTILSQERQRFQRRIQEEHLIFHQKNEEAKIQIRLVQEELKKMAQATQGLSEEIKKATLSAVVDPGTYHENFFDRIKKLIQFARKKIVESRTWMETFNQRAAKCSHYWGNVQKSGTKYMLSHERYMSTQAG